jgi:hypothetical protein
MPRKTRPTIPAKLHGDDREVVGFLTTLIDYDTQLIPTGQGIRHFLPTVPEGFLNCDGTAVSRTTYATLFQALGTTYGAGDGVTTFNLPNASGFVIKT